MVKQALHQVIPVPSYPSCDDCLAWSEDGLAIATDQTVHLIPNNKLKSLQNSVNTRIDTIRVDQFDYEEWPEYSLATTSNVSIGEEQSDSTVVALAWSPPGLGIHRTCVLSVLTSNLVLSFWESNGSHAGWRRTCVLNNVIRGRTSPDGQDIQPQTPRTTQHIRASAWLPPLKVRSGSRWGIHLLLTIDGKDCCTLWKISKSSQQHYGGWQIIALSSETIPQPTVLEQQSSMTTLQRFITCSSRITSLYCGSWLNTAAGSSHSYAVDVEYCRGSLFSGRSSMRILLETSSSQQEVCGTFLHVPSSERESSMQSPGSLSGCVPDIRMLYDWKSCSRWLPALKEICLSYQNKFELNKSRVRFWGSSLSPASDRLGVMVTLHSQDSYEYTTGVIEKSYLLIKTLENKNENTHVANETDREQVRRSALTMIAELMSDGVVIRDAFDRSLIVAWLNWMALSKSYEIEKGHLLDALRSWDASTASIVSNETNLSASVAQTNDAFDPLPITTETCCICDHSLSMDKVAETAKCSSGHTFSRCSLSLIAIQKPRISKYCTKCERQFLNSSKLGPRPDRNLIATIMDNFDVCPFCQGKYRG